MTYSQYRPSHKKPHFFMRFTIVLRRQGLASPTTQDLAWHSPPRLDKNIYKKISGSSSYGALSSERAATVSKPREERSLVGSFAKGLLKRETVFGKHMHVAVYEYGLPCVYGGLFVAVGYVHCMGWQVHTQYLLIASLNSLRAT